MAKNKLKTANVHANLVVGDVTKLKDINTPFDLALDLGCFHGLTPQGKWDYLTQLQYLLAPNGFWLLYGFLTPGTPRSGHGLAEADLNLISTQLTIISRRDGYDKRERLSAWFLFQKDAVG